MSDFERTIGLADIYGTRASVRATTEEDVPNLQLRVECGQCGATAYPTVEAARQLAAALLDAADCIEKSRAA